MKNRTVQNQGVVFLCYYTLHPNVELWLNA